MVLLKIKDSDEITMHCNDGQLRAGKGITMHCNDGQLRAGKGITMHCNDGQLRAGKGIQGNYIDANSELEKKDVKKLTKVA